MDCPICSGPLREGRLAIRRHLAERVDLRFDRKAEIHFVPADGSDETVLEQCQKSLALMCATCGMVVLDLRTVGPDIRTVPDDQSEDALCIACQGTIPAGSDTCPKCGWSYNVSQTEDSP
jgi:hypothetical protein